jgi:putative ATPase
LGGRVHLYDKSGEEHYNLISALHKSLRGSDADASLYWLHRMLASGEDPMYLVRRLIRFASEDVGLADPQALVLAVAARDAYHMLGSPEGELALAQLVVYLARAPKDVSIYRAARRVSETIAEAPDLPVPLHLRNAPTELMKELGYSKGYQYPPDHADRARNQSYLPDALAGRRWLEEPSEPSRAAGGVTIEDPNLPQDPQW